MVCEFCALALHHYNISIFTFNLKFLCLPLDVRFIHFAQMIHRYMGIDLCSRKRRMAKQFLHDRISAPLSKDASQRMPKHMGMHLHPKIDRIRVLLHQILNASSAHLCPSVRQEHKFFAILGIVHPISKLILLQKRD